MSDVALTPTDLRRKILEVATRLFAERGFSGTSVRELVEACDCTKPSLYYYFGSKEALFTEVVQRHMNEMSQMIRDWTAEAGPIRELVPRALDSFVDYAEANPEVMRLLQRVELQSEQGMPDVELMAIRELHLELLRGLFARGIEAGELRTDIDPLDCALVIAGTLSFQIEIAVASDRWDRERIHRTISLVFDGISP